MVRHTSPDDRSALPFRRYDVVDRHARAILTGPSLDRLEPVAGRSLEPELEREVRALLHERLPRRTAVSTGLIGLDYAVRVVEEPAVGGGFFLVCCERASIRGAFERLAARFSLDDDERALLRLLVAGYDDTAIAIRLGACPMDAGRRTARLMQRLRVATRAAVVEMIFPRQRLSRDHRVRPAEAR